MTIAPEVVTAAFAAVVAAVGRAAWVIYRDLRNDRDDWKRIALQLAAVNNKSIDVAATVIQPDA